GEPIRERLRVVRQIGGWVVVVAGFAMTISAILCIANAPIVVRVLHFVFWTGVLPGVKAFFQVNHKNEGLRKAADQAVESAGKQMLGAIGACVLLIVAFAAVFFMGLANGVQGVLLTIGVAGVLAAGGSFVAGKHGTGMAIAGLALLALLASAFMPAAKHATNRMNDWATSARSEERQEEQPRVRVQARSYERKQPVAQAQSAPAKKQPSKEILAQRAKFCARNPHLCKGR
ncbi:TPA: hypothetical protein DCZ32_00795, partial [Candidatus Uhrbacteria bacterium]|nr:hypothetical protein [Candidatus Uhrbacteria bacterium]